MISFKQYITETEGNTGSWWRRALDKLKGGSKDSVSTGDITQALYVNGKVHLPHSDWDWHHDIIKYLNPQEQKSVNRHNWGSGPPYGFYHHKQQKFYPRPSLSYLDSAYLPVHGTPAFDVKIKNPESAINVTPENVVDHAKDKRFHTQPDKLAHLGNKPRRFEPLDSDPTTQPRLPGMDYQAPGGWEDKNWDTSRNYGRIQTKLIHTDTSTHAQKQKTYNNLFGPVKQDRSKGKWNLSTSTSTTTTGNKMYKVNWKPK